MPLSYQQFQEFNRGISNDRFLGQWYARDVDWCNIRQSSKWVVLANNDRTLQTVASPDWYIIAFLTDVNNWIDSNNTYWICEGKVFDVDSGNWWLNSLAAARNALFVESDWVNYGAIITTTAIWRWNNDSASITAAASYLPLTWTSDYRAVLLDWAFLYIGGDWVVDCIDLSTSTWSIYKTLNMKGICRWLSKQWDQIFVYTNDWLNWYKMSWDWVSIFPQYIQKRADNPVINVANIDNTDYVITWAGSLDQTQKYRRLFMSSGFEKELLYGSDFITYNKQLFNFNPIETNAIETYWNVIYIPETNKVYTYWNTKSQQAPSLIKELVIDDTILRITALYVTNQNSMLIGFVTLTGTIKYVVQDLRVWYAYGSTGSIETLSFDWGDIETEKQCNRVIVWYKLYDNTTIDIFARINNDEERVFDCTWVTTNPTLWDTYTYNWLTYTVKEYTDSDELICTRWENWPQNDSIMYSSGTLTRTFWPWDATITFTNVDNHRFIETITDTTKRKANIELKKDFYEMSIKAVLNTESESITPELYSIKALFDFTDLQNG